jgi:hypothetical protein
MHSVSQLERRSFANSSLKLSKLKSRSRIAWSPFHSQSLRFGWFWECPNGIDCKYRHALPPGFVLKSEKKALDEAARANQISLEDFLETERHKLGSNLTPVTPESFAKWKRTRLDKKTAAEEAMKKAKDTQAAAGKNSGMSGRDLVKSVVFAFMHELILHAVPIQPGVV